MTKGPRGAPVVDNVYAPDVYADDALSFSIENGVVRVTLAATRPLQTGGQIGHVVIGRLIMPVAGAHALSVGLFNYLKECGLTPAAISADKTASN